MDTHKPEFITQEQIVNTPKSNWYRYTLNCGHTVYTRVRLSFRIGDQQHFIRCPQGIHATAWQPVENIEAVTDEHVSNVHDGTSFVLPGRILRTDGPGCASGNPFPYTTKNREY